ncbi:MAG: GNAT family N-acetyltransferase [Actinomycetes bacterium]
MIRLRALTDEDIPLLDARADPSIEGEFNDFGPIKDPGALKRVVQMGVTAGSPEGYLVVEVDGQVAGSVSWHTVAYGPNVESRCPNIGIALRPEWRGKGHGATAQRMLADYLMTASGINRVEASTDVENIAEQQALERAGFTREGVLRGAQWRNHAWHDLVSYARLRTDA